MSLEGPLDWAFQLATIKLYEFLIHKIEETQELGAGIHKERNQNFFDETLHEAEASIQDETNVRCKKIT